MQTETFKLDEKAVGKLSKLRLDVHGGGATAQWHLEHIEVRDVETNLIYCFPCQEWVKSGTKLKPVVTELPVQRIEELKAGQRRLVQEFKPLSPVQYLVQVHTGDRAGAGTDANVFIIITGANGDSGERALIHSKTHVNKFQRAAVDEFEIDAVDLGALSKVKVWHDNKGLGGAWFLHKVVVVDSRDKKAYTFPCDQWLAKNKEDGQVARELGVQNEHIPEELRTKAVAHTYKVFVHTSDIKHAGTDANVHICLYGQHGDTGDVPLAHSLSHRDKFERGHTDEFAVSAVNLGDLQKIRIGHDGHGAGSGWHLSKVVVESGLDGKRWTFPCDQWMDKGVGDGSLERVLMPQVLDDKGTTAEATKVCVPWEVVIRTSDVAGAGTNADVFMEVYGRTADKKDHSASFEFAGLATKASFERGKEDRFNIELPEVGQPYKLRIGHNRKGFSSSWHLESVKLINQRTQEAFEFPCNQWLSADKDDKKTVRELAVSQHLAFDKRNGSVVRRNSLVKLVPRTYSIHTFTGSLKGAGTDANVFIQLFGENGDSGEVPLSKSKLHRDKFEKGQEDVFEHQCLDLGALKTVKIWHDNSGLLQSADWYLDRVEVCVAEATVEGSPSGDADSSQRSSKGASLTAAASKQALPAQKFVFPCQQWLSKKQDDGQICRELKVQAPISAATGSADEGAKTMSLSSKTQQKETGAGPGRERDNKVNRPGSSRPAAASAPERSPASSRLQKQISVEDVDSDEDEDIQDTTSVFLTKGGKKTAGLKKTGSVKSRKADGEEEEEDEAQDEVEDDEDDLNFRKQRAAMKTQARDHVNEPGARPRSALKEQESHSKQTPAVSQHSGSQEKTKGDSASGPVTYEVKVVTSKERGAGTDNNVFLTLHGSTGACKEQALTKSQTHRNKFERGQTDIFLIECQDLGKLSEATVRMEAGALLGGGDWLLDHVSVHHPLTGQDVVFPANQWFSKKAGLEHRLVPGARRDSAEARPALPDTEKRVSSARSGRANRGSDVE